MALTARVAVLWILAVCCLGEDFGSGCFTGSSCAAEKVRVAYSILFYLISYGRNYRILAFDVVKDARAVFTV